MTGSHLVRSAHAPVESIGVPMGSAESTRRRDYISRMQESLLLVAQSGSAPWPRVRRASLPGRVRTESSNYSGAISMSAGTDDSMRTKAA